MCSSESSCTRIIQEVHSYSYIAPVSPRSPLTLAPNYRPFYPVVPISQSLCNGYNYVLAFSLPIYEQIFFPKIRQSVSDILPVVPDTKNGCSTMLSSDQGPLECVLWKGGEPSALPRCVVWADHGPPLNHWIPPPSLNPRQPDSSHSILPFHDRIYLSSPWICVKVHTPTLRRPPKYSYDPN